MPRDNDTFFCDVYAGDDIYWPRGPELCQGPGDDLGLVATGQLDQPDPALDLAAFASLISAARSGYEK